LKHNKRSLIFKSTHLKLKRIFCILGNAHGNQPAVETAVEAVDTLKGAVKCSLAHLVDINTTGTVVKIKFRGLFKFSYKCKNLLKKYVCVSRRLYQL
jgi:hypothetical protein